MSVLPSSLCGGATAPVVRTRTLHVVPEAHSLPAVVGSDLRVPTLHGEVAYANLDHAASTPALETVREAVDRALRTYSSVHRGAGFASRVTSAWFEQARAEVAAFVGARADDTVIFTRSTTDSWALLSKALPSRTTVFVFGTEHHSTLLPWGASARCACPFPRRSRTPGSCSRRRSSTTRRGTASSCSPRPRTSPARCGRSSASPPWRTSTVRAWPWTPPSCRPTDHRPRRLGRRLRGLLGHKTYAPYGAGVLAGRSDWLDAGNPYLLGGGATRSVTEDGTTWATGPARHEGGSPNVIGAVALAAACATITRHREAIEAHEEQLLGSLRAGLEEVPGVELLSIFGDEHDRVGVVAFTVDGWDSSLVSQVLSVEHGIGVRDGKFCAHLLVDELLDDPWGERSTTAVRASIGLGSTLEASSVSSRPSPASSRRGPTPRGPAPTQGGASRAPTPATSRSSALVTRPGWADPAGWSHAAPLRCVATRRAQTNHWLDSLHRAPSPRLCVASPPDAPRPATA